MVPNRAKHQIEKTDSLKSGTRLFREIKKFDIILNNYIFRSNHYFAEVTFNIGWISIYVLGFAFLNYF